MLNSRRRLSVLHSIVFDEITVEVQFAVSLVTFEFVEPPLGVVNL